MLQALTNSSIVALLSMVVALLPLAAGIGYAIAPTEQRLALLRPLSLAGIFAGLSGTFVGFLNVLRGIGESGTPVRAEVAIGVAEALVPLVLALGCLTVAWLCVALGMRRHA